MHVPIIQSRDVESLGLPFFQHQIDIEIVERIIRGKIFCLNANKPILRKFEAEVHHVFFSDIKQFNSISDIRTVWEPARLQHLSVLLVYAVQSPKLSNSKLVKQFAKDAVLEWIKDNPFLFGPHYISSMECGLRIPVFFYLLKSYVDLSPHEYRQILDAMYLHAWWISKRLSLYSSLGNHTIAECVGLIFAGAIFRTTKEGKDWLEKGVNLLKKELKHQVLEDGGPAEQSLNYHRFVLDLYWLSVDFLERNNLYDCSVIKPRLIQGEDFLSAFQDTLGSMPSIGDSDDGYAIAPGIAPLRAEFHIIKKSVKVFKDSGYTVMNTENDVILTFDHGPLGMPPLYNHGHADALSVTLTKEGQQILVDPGTYRYNGVSEWRRYFKGTRAHNTVTIDGLDQAVQETSFMWSHPYKVKLLGMSEQGDELLVKANHDGYSRLKEKVWHGRLILFANKTDFLIEDSFYGEGIHKFELNYHLHPGALLTKSGDWWLISINGVELFLKLTDEPDFILVNGQKDPLLGWYSPSYGIKIKSGVLSCSRIGSPNEISFTTLICTETPKKTEYFEERLSKFGSQAENS